MNSRALEPTAWDQFWFVEPAGSEITQVRLRVVTAIAACAWLLSWSGSWLETTGFMSAHTVSQLASFPVGRSLVPGFTLAWLPWLGAAVCLWWAATGNRWANALVWAAVLLVSHRNPIVQGPASAWLAMLLMYCFIASVGARAVAFRLAQLHTAALLATIASQQLAGGLWRVGDTVSWLAVVSPWDATWLTSRQTLAQLLTHLLALYPWLAAIAVAVCDRLPRFSLRVVQAGVVYWGLLGWLHLDLLHACLGASVPWVICCGNKTGRNAADTTAI